MVFATATSKGQITIPVAIRRKLGIKSGTRIRFVPTHEGYELQPMPTDSLRQMRGMFSGNGKHLSPDELSAAIDRAAIESGLQGLSADER